MTVQFRFASPDLGASAKLEGGRSERRPSVPERLEELFCLDPSAKQKPLPAEQFARVQLCGHLLEEEGEGNKGTSKEEDWGNGRKSREGEERERRRGGGGGGREEKGRRRTGEGDDSEEHFTMHL
eukprot:1604375-Pyramimonas_sp.AAC.1